MADLPAVRTPAGASQVLGFQANPHHERTQRSEAAGGDAIRALELAVDFAKSKPESKPDDVVSAAKAFFAFLSGARG